MRKIFTLLLLVAGFAATAQQYNNEWIQYGQTYYKFKVAKDGVYRIPQSLLNANGLGNVAVQFLELWRNGEKVPFYPSVSSGVLPSGGYLEFWGERNDGKPDKALYRAPEFQHTTKYSLQTDTAVYFLSVNTNQSGFRYNEVTNNVAGNSLPAEQYFMHTADSCYFSSLPNNGFGQLVGGTYVYSSSYDQGEFFSSGDIRPATNFVTSLSNLKVYAGGPPSMIKFGATGNAPNTRHIKVRVNGVEVKDTIMNFFDDLVSLAPVATSGISSGTAAVQFINTSGNSTDRMRVSFFAITYPRTFDFNNRANFKFELPAKSGGYYLEISNFTYGSVQPVLYDRKNGERFVGDLAGGKVRFALPGSFETRELVLVSEDGSNIRTVTELVHRNFINYALAANQGNYIIVTNPILYTGSSGNNPITDFKNYRESAAGGGHQVLVAEIQELTDQFAFGISKHPLSIRNFIRYARTHFATPLKNVFLIGRGTNYAEYQYRNRTNHPLNDYLNLVPTFGNPGSDNLLSAENIQEPVAATPIGRLSVVHGYEIEYYLDKVKEYEQAQRNSFNTVADRGWMKNVIHVTGASDAFLGTVLCNYMEIYQQIIEDTLFGARVHTFCKNSANPNEQVSPDKIANLFAEGISFLTYFGHSSATTLEFNIDDPQNYNNKGKYPVFFVNGCKAGDFFSFYEHRLTANETLSEKFTLARERGTIGFVASTHFGIVNYLNLFMTGLYETIARKDYNKTLGETMRDAMAAMLKATGSYDFYSRIHTEQITLHGDPAILINAQPKPDYVIEGSLIKITPPFISIAERNYEVKVKVMNLGKAVPDSVVFEVKQQYPDGSMSILYSQKIGGVRESDSVVLTIPIVDTRDKGQNKIIATIDAGGAVDEISESNNTASKDFYIYEDEARPIYPYAYAIINTPNQKLYASSANPLSSLKKYVMEIDTTGTFTSNLKVRKYVMASGGVIEFDHGLQFIDSTVYYWRIAPETPVESDIRWNTASFMYINGSVEGFNQSQYFQHRASGLNRISIDSMDHIWRYGTRESSVIINNGVFPDAAGQAKDFGVTINSDDKIQSVCGVSGLIFYVFDSVSLRPWYNGEANSPGKYGSDPVCGDNRRWQFQFNFTAGDTAKRRKVVEFMDLIPAGSYVVVNNIFHNRSPNVYAETWMGDTSYLGKNNSIYHRLLEQGFVGIDSINQPRSFIFFYRKNRQGFFTPRFVISKDGNDRIKLSTKVITPDTIGFINSPKYGPARAWKRVLWDGSSIESPSNDNPTVEVVGSDYNGNETILYRLDKNSRDFDISSIDVDQYPFVQLKMRNVDSVTVSPFQLKYWRVLYDPVPEGSLAASMYYMSKDTVALGEKVTFGIAFKNVSRLNFDSMLVKVTIIDRNNNTHVLSSTKFKPLVAGDTITVTTLIDSKEYSGNNIVQIIVNPDNHQPEQYHFNNVWYHNLYVIPDMTKPLLDVTFDGVHILNKDIVSAKPRIQIKIKDESKYMLLNDTAISTVQVLYPDGTLRKYHFDGDTLRFVPATNTSDNTATVEFTPQFTTQLNPEGDDYELIVTGKDISGNRSGDIAYRVGFRVIAKPMISNLLNYPNPFSTSTAFVFTITGSEIPQNIRIQILTVTGKIVREITMNELGPLHIGRNITEFKWNGTDQYGQKLANGVYLYRVITSLNGRPMDKYKASGDDTDKYFNNGYGKMYLMR